MMWEQGRNLVYLMMGTSYVSFEYNDQGIRTSKTLSNGTTYNYILDGTRIVAETWDDELLIFLYDDNGSPIGMQSRYSGYAENEFDTYWFEKNLQGDIIAVYNENGIKLVTYTYDAWGNFTTTYCNGGENDYALDFNPFRYRGYYYDEETGFYYLNSRYYDPVTGRFINADVYISTGKGILGNNMYAYCRNNPVMRYDYTGYVEIDNMDNNGDDTPINDFGPVNTGHGYSQNGWSSGSGHHSSSGGGSWSSRSGYSRSSSGGSWSSGSGYSSSSGGGRWSSGSGYSSSNIGACFIEGTLIASANGKTPIEDIREGDLVWATNPETGETALKEVVHLFRNQTYEWVHITANGEEITCTPEHPFYSPIKGWTTAIDLRAGDILVLLNGEYVVVEQVQHELLERAEITYNFEVADFHTYYVGENHVLVHNVCSEDIYSNLRDSPDYNPDFRPAQGTQYKPMTNSSLADDLSALDPGRWRKAYQNGYIYGERVSIHYFNNLNNNHVFNVKYVYEWVK